MKHNQPPPIVFIGNQASTLFHFRQNLIKSLVDRGEAVITIAQSDGEEKKLTELGTTFYAIPIKPGGRNPFKDLQTFFCIFNYLRKLKPKLVLTYTIKPVLYGALSARLLKIPFVSIVTGLGTQLQRKGLLSKILTKIFSIGHKFAYKVLFLNIADFSLFQNSRLLKKGQGDILPGEGVDLVHYKPSKLPSRTSFKFLYIGRLLKDKGIIEYLEAARLMKTKHPDTEFHLVGSFMSDNPTAISKDELAPYINDKTIFFHGEQKDVRPFIKSAHVIVLPSYREGLPRVLLEAAAMSRPIVATKVPGCEDLVHHKKNGFLCQPRSPRSLKIHLEKMFKLPEKDLEDMGEYGHRLVLENFSDAKVLAYYRRLLKPFLK